MNTIITSASGCASNRLSESIVSFNNDNDLKTCYMKQNKKCYNCTLVKPHEACCDIQTSLPNSIHCVHNLTMKKIQDKKNNATIDGSDVIISRESLCSQIYWNIMISSGSHL